VWISGELCGCRALEQKMAERDEKGGEESGSERGSRLVTKFSAASVGQPVVRFLKGLLE